MLRPPCILFAVWTRGSVARIGLRPPLRPLARAAARPALVLSWINRRSNCARAVKMWKTSSPLALVVSITPSEIDLNPIPRCRSSSTKSIRCRIDRPNLSSRQTINTSPCLSCSRHRSSPGLADFEPDTLSVKMPPFAHPAWVRASSWSFSSWPFVETRA